MPFQIIRNDITRVKADAIVNTANPQPVIGGGTDSAIYHAAGEEQLLAERGKIGEIAPGSAVSTPAFDLNAKYIIHTVGPMWIDGNYGEKDVLHACYENSLALAADLKCESIAFPLIATGVYGFPKDAALDIALEEIGKFLLTHDMEVILVVFDRSALQLSQALVGDIEEYIDEHTADLLREKEYISFKSKNRRRIFDGFRHIVGREKQSEDLMYEEAEEITRDTEASLMECYTSPITVSPVSASEMSLDDILARRGETFQQRLFRLIDERHMTDPEVYKKANIDRKVFSKIRCNPEYHPKKKTAVAFAIALELDMPAMQDLLSRAGLAISPSSKFDLIVSYFVDRKIYDIFEINAALFRYDQELLGY